MAFDLTQKAFEKLRAPEPEPNWRSMYEAEKAAHEETKSILKMYMRAFTTTLADQEGYKIG